MQQGKIGLTIITFVIGFIAGIAPFLCMQILPALLDPSKEIDLGRNAGILVIFGVMIGAICAIVFEKKMENGDAGEVFFKALGIPAILLATVTNLSTTYSSKQAVNEAREKASLTVLGTIPQPQETIPNLRLVSPEKLSQLPASQPPLKSFLLPEHAWAQGSTGGGKTLLLAEANRFLVIVGRYGSLDEARRVLQELSARKLSTERYWPKNIQLYEAGKNLYYLSYSAPASKSEATKLYELIRINDPSLSPQLVEIR